MRRRQQQQPPPPRHAKTRAGRLSTPAWPAACPARRFDVRKTEKITRGGGGGGGGRRRRARAGVLTVTFDAY